MQDERDSSYGLNGEAKNDQGDIEEAIKGASDGISRPSNSRPESTLRALSLNSFTQACSVSSVSMIQTVSEADDTVIGIQPTSSNISAMPEIPMLPSEPNGRSNVVWVQSPSPSVPNMEIPLEPTIPHVRIESTPRSGFTAISNNSSVNPYGTRIGKNHSSYLLMYYMLTGIRSSVSKEEERCALASPSSCAEIEKQAFKERVNFFLENREVAAGCCPYSKKKTREFKDYAPIAFKFLRKQFFIDSEDYLVCYKDDLSSLGGLYC